MLHCKLDLFSVFWWSFQKPQLVLQLKWAENLQLCVRAGSHSIPVCNGKQHFLGWRQYWHLGWDCCRWRDFCLFVHLSLVMTRDPEQGAIQHSCIWGGGIILDPVGSCSWGKRPESSSDWTWTRGHAPPSRGMNESVHKFWSNQRNTFRKRASFISCFIPPWSVCSPLPG